MSLAVGSGGDIIDLLRSFGISVNAPLGEIKLHPAATQYLAAALPVLLEATNLQNVDLIINAPDVLTFRAEFPLWQLHVDFSKKRPRVELSFLTGYSPPDMLPILGRLCLSEYFPENIEKAPLAALALWFGLPVTEVGKVLQWIPSEAGRRVLAGAEIMSKLLKTLQDVFDRISLRYDVWWFRPYPMSRSSFIEESEGYISWSASSELREIQNYNYFQSLLNILRAHSNVPLWVFAPTGVEVFIVPQVEEARTVIYVPLPVPDLEEEDENPYTRLLWPQSEEICLLLFPKPLKDLKQELLKKVAENVKGQQSPIVPLTRAVALNELHREVAESTLVAENVPSWVLKNLELSSTDKAMIDLMKTIKEKRHLLY